MTRGRANATMKISSAVPRQKQHEQRCISAVFAFIFYCFGMRSDAAEDESRDESTTGNLRNLLELPMNCINTILSFTTPRDVCRLAAVSTLFRSAANSDSVWNKFIPPQCYQILPTAVTFNLLSSKRELYFRLCDSILIDGGRKRFWLERSTAKIGYMLSARELDIVWGDDQRYWLWISRKDSRFNELAELLSVYWLDVGGGMDCALLSPDTEYRVVFLLRFLERSHGWNAGPIKFSVKTPGKGEMESEHLFLEDRPHINTDGWIEMVAGEFTVRAAEAIAEDSSHISFRMKEVEANQSLGGLLIDGVRIEPSSAPLQSVSFGMRSAAVLRAKPTQARRIQVQYDSSISMRSDATADESAEESTIGDGLDGHEQKQELFRNLSELPKKCIKTILSFTTPRDVCRLAAVSTRFRSAANSDFVWNKFIPPQFYQILPTAVTFGLFSSKKKKELYFRLCDSIRIEEGKKIFWLDRSTAKIGYMISARGLHIEWSNNQRYWCWVPRDDSRFDELAELLEVYWLDVSGKMDCRLLSSDTEYRVVFMIKFTEHSYGWTGQSVKFAVTTPWGEEITSEQLLVEKKGDANDGWREVVAAEFTVIAAEDIEDDDSSSMSFRMAEVTDSKKCGLLIDGVKIEPCKSS